MAPKNVVKLTSLPPKTVYYGVHKTPYGELVVGLTEEGALCRLQFLGQSKAVTALKEWQRAWPKTEFIEKKKETEKVIKKISGKNTGLKIQMVGTEFQQKVWKALIEIPYGKVVSYGDIAKRIKKPRAVRAVGGAIGANPVPILIPCHRVIASGGKIGGYTGGLATKKKLLKAEKVNIFG